MPLSIVILVCRSDAAGIEKTLQSVEGIGADVLVYDTSHIGQVKEISTQYGARYQPGDREGYEPVRYKAGMLALHDWILMLHTGEQLDQELRNSLLHFDFDTHQPACRIRFRKQFENHLLSYGEWGRVMQIRLAYRSAVKVADQKVNENIFSLQGIPVRKIRGAILNAEMTDGPQLSRKLSRQALCFALKSHRKGYRAGRWRMFCSPVASFFQSYFMKLGILDGWPGFVCARLLARYSYLKYAGLRKLNLRLKAYPETAKYAK